MNLMENILDFKDKVLEFIFPPRCIFCSKVVAVGSDICNDCFIDIAPQAFTRTILEWGEEDVKCISAFEYDGKVRKAIWRFKFRGQKHYAKYFSKVISDEIRDICKNVDVVTAVPLSKLGMRKRGYNQAECFARLVAKNLKINYGNLLIKYKENFPQHELTLKERLENVRGVYKILDISSVKNKNILLCDDVVTTGSTLKECVKLLKMFGANSVICCTIAYV